MIPHRPYGRACKDQMPLMQVALLAVMLPKYQEKLRDLASHNT